MILKSWLISWRNGLSSLLHSKLNTGIRQEKPEDVVIKRVDELTALVREIKYNDELDNFYEIMEDLSDKVKQAEYDTRIYKQITENRETKHKS